MVSFTCTTFKLSTIGKSIANASNMYVNFKHKYKFQNIETSHSWKNPGTWTLAYNCQMITVLMIFLKITFLGNSNQIFKEDTNEIIWGEHQRRIKELA